MAQSVLPVQPLFHLGDKWSISVTALSQLKMQGTFVDEERQKRPHLTGFLIPRPARPAGGSHHPAGPFAPF